MCMYVVTHYFTELIFTALFNHVDQLVRKHSPVVEPIPMSEFPDHVKLMHLRGKDSFAAEFKVYTCTSVKIAGMEFHLMLQLVTLHSTTALGFSRNVFRVFQYAPLSPLLWERRML